MCDCKPLPHGSLPFKILREVSSSLGQDAFSAIPLHLPPLFLCVLAVIRLAPRWDRLGAGRATFQSAPHTPISNTNSFPKRERTVTIPNIVFSGEYTGIFLEVQVPASRCHRVWFCGIKFRRFFLDRQNNHQIKNLAKIFPLYGMLFPAYLEDREFWPQIYSLWQAPELGLLPKF